MEYFIILCRFKYGTYIYHTNEYPNIQPIFCLFNLCTGAIFDHEVATRRSMFELGVREANRYLQKYDIKLESAIITNATNVFSTSRRGKTSAISTVIQ